MRRDIRKKQKDKKIVIYSIAGGLVVLALIATIVMYGNALNGNSQKSQLNSEQIAKIVNDDRESESASSSIGKSIEEEEKQSEIEKNKTKENTTSQNSTTNKENSANKNNASVNTNSSNTAKQTSVQQKASTENTTSNTKKDEKVVEQTKKELCFQMPIEGETVCEFAKENLIYSETLQEWITHNGIDIKAEKATVVQSAEDGKVKSIKNDPRYGLTIVIEHEDGYQTVYANLLSSEFVTEGENVVKGQSIGTVGNTAAFESADEPHLHFEVIKDSVQVDPNIYLKNKDS